VFVEGGDVERMTRLELATYAMARRRSSQLSYIRLKEFLAINPWWMRLSRDCEQSLVPIELHPLGFPGYWSN
jgi:hypothetical protein